MFMLPDAVFDGDTLQTGVVLQVRDRRCVAVLNAGDIPENEQTTQIIGTLTPGFIDLQVNGGGGVWVNTSPDSGGLQTVRAAHHQFGTVAMLPTVITDQADVMDSVAEAVLRDDATLGLHIEGPHIALARRGTHAAQFIRPVDARTIATVAKLRAAGKVVMITLAPEAATLDDIRTLTRTGAIVSIGHSDADAAQVDAAMGAGARCFTHLFNAMSPMQGRAPGVVGAAINSNAYCGIICDGHHVADEMIALAIRARPLADRMFLVSDAMPTVGGPDAFTLYDQRIALIQGRLVNVEGNLAGAHVTQAQGVTRLVQHVGIAPGAALRMAITVPAQLIGMDRLARITDRPVSDIAILRPDLTFQAMLDTILDEN